MPYSDQESQKSAQRSWYERNKKRTYARSKERRERDFAWLDEQKAKPCMDCGRAFPPFVMEFHHRDRSEKVMGVSQMIIQRSRSAVVDEIEKCDLVCSNCHKIREYAENNRYSQ